MISASTISVRCWVRPTAAWVVARQPIEITSTRRRLAVSTTTTITSLQRRVSNTGKPFKTSLYEIRAAVCQQVARVFRTWFVKLHKFVRLQVSKTWVTTYSLPFSTQVGLCRTAALASTDDKPSYSSCCYYHHRHPPRRKEHDQRLFARSRLSANIAGDNPSKVIALFV